MNILQETDFLYDSIKDGALSFDSHQKVFKK